MTAEQILDRLHELLGEVVLLPIPLGEKGPKEPGWQALTFAETQKRRDELLNVIRRGGNIGVLLGPNSDRLLTLDIDRDELVDQWLARCPWLANTTRSRGKRGCQFWFRLAPDCEYPDAKAVYRLSEGNKAVGEIRLGGCGGAQSVIFGVHPDGMRYRIEVKQPPLVISPTDLDELAPGVLFGEVPKDLSPAPVQALTTNNGASVRIETTERIRLYMAKVPPSIEGQNGDDQLFRAASILVNGWGLGPDEAFPFLAEYNQRAEPPWPEQRLHYKLKEAFEKPGDKPMGHLRDSDKRPLADPPLSKRLKEEQARTPQDDCDANAEPIDLEAETQERLKRYTTDPEPFPPPMRPEAFHGLIGEIVSIIVKHCESSPEVLLLHGLVIIGNIVGRSAYLNAGETRLFTNEFAAFVGETARSRKGTAYRAWERLIELVNLDWLDGCLSSQLQSGEGVVHRIRDEQYGLPKGKKPKKDEPVEEVLLDPGVSDKRLMVIEEEFAHMPKMSERSGNTLSVTLRRAWDSPRLLRTDNKNSPLKAGDPHVSLIGHATRTELLETLSPVELKNGMANRVLWCAARRTGDLPNAEPIDWKNQESDVIDRLEKVFHQRFANTDEPAFFSRSPDAKNYWDQLYRKLNGEKRDSTMDAILARDTSHILKLALIFAVTDQVCQIDVQHLKAALAVVDFCQAGARWIFGKATGDKLANNILWALRRSPAGLTRNNINEDICYGKTPKTQVDRALSELAKNGLATLTVEKAEKGRSTERWFATA